MDQGATEHGLEVTTPSDREIVMTRDFKAPRERVFDAFTKPNIMKRWLLAPDGWSLAVCDIDLSVGGAFRYVWRNGTDAQEFVVRGIYTEITRPELVVHTETFDDPAYPGEWIETWAFDEHDDVTTLTMTLRYESTEARNRALESGMEQELGAGYDCLAALFV